MKMEAPETLISNPVSSMEDDNLKAVVVQADVDLGTNSTVDPAVSAAFQQDASVVSGMTAGSLEETKRVLARGHDGTVQLVDPEVPKQVILTDEVPGTPPPERLSPTPPDEAPLVVTMTPPDGNNSTVSLSALPDRLTDLEAPAADGRTSTDEVAVRPRSVSPVAQEVASSKDDSLDDYIRSPEVQNAIVERSPGSRYVRFTEKLGSGASKDVFRAYDTQEGIEVAWNVVNLSGVPKSERNRIVNEVRLLERLHHHNIISFHGSWVNRERQEVNFVTEILSSGTLKSFINKVQVIRWKIAKRWAVQILHGLAYLHSQDPPVIHRDLKCENIFINGTSGDLRIGDLGLSTVHRNGRVLSVLGTPEFMAPDMYEESSYDEKVDIYAFGLCMLEIFTKEIPYSECHNPAQIYKKVSSGAPPSVLMRLQSHHAREFVLLCLGYKDENGNYIRPTASELLKHPFLEKRENDDDEVVVDLPLSQRAIAESAAESSSPSGTPMANRYPVVESDKESAPPARKMQPNNTLDEDGDRFEEMPESEVNMLKVKVLMGRGHELEEDEPKVTEIVRSIDENSGVKERPAEPATRANPSITGSSPAVLEHENLNVRPYADDVLKLVVTLPVDGQTQNVQFDFHLVQDDPVQVGKEMVHELGIPQGAVLEISETISGLACAARMKQDKHAVRMHNAQNQMLAQSQSQQALQQLQNQGTAQGSSQDMLQNPSQNSISSPDYAGTAPVQHAQEAALHDQQGQMQQQQAAQPSVYAQSHSQPYGHAPISYENQPQQQAPAQHQQQAYAQDPSAPPPPPQQQVSMHSQVPVQQQQQAYNPGPVATPPAPQQRSQYNQLPAQQQQHHDAYAPAAVAPPPSPSQQQQQQSQQHQQQYAHAQPQQAYAHPQSPQQKLPHSQAPFQQQQQQEHAYAPQRQQEQAYAPQQQQEQAYAPGPNAPPSQPSVQQQQQEYAPGPGTHVPQQQEYAPGPVARPLQQQEYAPVSAAPLPQQQEYASSPVVPPPPPHHQVQQPPPQAQAQQQSLSRSPAASPSQAQHNRPITGAQIPQPDYAVPAGQAPAANQAACGGQAVPAPPQGVVPVPLAPSLASNASTTGKWLETSDTGVHFQAAEENRSNPAVYRNSDSEISAPVPHPTKLAQRRATTGSSGTSSNEKRQPLNGSTSSSSLDEGYFEETDDEVNAELRKLGEDFQKNLLRAKKVFDNRMDSLQRSQVEREVQHQKTLERHEKERADFEKRLAQEAEQQSRRIEQLQRDWDRRRESLAQHKRNSQSPNSPDTSESTLPEGPQPGITHSRSVSSTSNYTISPAMTMHKQPNDEPER